MVEDQYEQKPQKIYDTKITKKKKYTENYKNLIQTARC